MLWRSTDEPPRCGEPIVMKGRSNMRAPHDVVYVSGWYESEYPGGRVSPPNRWRTTDGSNVLEYGWEITHWVYAEELEAAVDR